MKTKNAYNTILRTLAIFIAGASWYLSPAFADGGEKGDAAKSVYCDATSDGRFPVAGWYVLDYALKEDFFSTRDRARDDLDINQSLTTVKNKFKKELPSKLGESQFSETEFIESLGTQLGNEISLEETEKNKFDIVSNCHQNTTKQIAKYYNGKYFYSNDSLTQLKNTSQLQYNIVVEHELSRQFSESTEMVFKWVKVFHSKDFYVKTGLEFQKYLLNEGLITEVEIKRAQLKELLGNLLSVEQHQKEIQSQMAAAKKLVEEIDDASSVIQIADGNSKCEAIRGFFDKTPNIKNRLIEFQSTIVAIVSNTSKLGRDLPSRFSNTIAKMDNYLTLVDERIAKAMANQKKYNCNIKIGDNDYISVIDPMRVANSDNRWVGLIGPFRERENDWYAKTWTTKSTDESLFETQPFQSGYYIIVVEGAGAMLVKKEAGKPIIVELQKISYSLHSLPEFYDINFKSIREDIKHSNGDDLVKYHIRLNQRDFPNQINGKKISILCSTQYTKNGQTHTLTPNPTRESANFYDDCLKTGVPAMPPSSGNYALTNFEPIVPVQYYWARQNNWWLSLSEAKDDTLKFTVLPGTYEMKLNDHDGKTFDKISTNIKFKTFK
jgi:hypothetical protein